jgi:hypothetical protein
MGAKDWIITLEIVLKSKKLIKGKKDKSSNRKYNNVGKKRLF